MIPMLGKFSIAMGITHCNKATCCSHAKIHTSKSSKLITAITSHKIKASSLGSWPNNKKYGEKNEGEPC
jgi:hypothetical protein